MIRVTITDKPFQAETEAANFAAARNEACGAVVTFIGYCRASSAAGEVQCLELDHYPGFTEAEVTRLTHAVAGRHVIAHALVIHRVGAIAPGEPIVLVAVSSVHRAAAFAAAEELMDRLKTDAPFWKREHGADGNRWIEPTAEDYARRQEHET